MLGLGFALLLLQGCAPRVDAPEVMRREARFLGVNVRALHPAVDITSYSSIPVVATHAGARRWHVRGLLASSSRVASGCNVSGCWQVFRVPGVGSVSAGRSCAGADAADAVSRECGSAAWQSAFDRMSQAQQAVYGTDAGLPRWNVHVYLVPDGDGFSGHMRFKDTHQAVVAFVFREPVTHARHRTGDREDIKDIVAKVGYELQHVFFVAMHAPNDPASLNTAPGLQRNEADSQCYWHVLETRMRAGSDEETHIDRMSSGGGDALAGLLGSADPAEHAAISGPAKLDDALSRHLAKRFPRLDSGMDIAIPGTHAAATRAVLDFCRRRMHRPLVATAGAPVVH